MANQVHDTVWFWFWFFFCLLHWQAAWISARAGRMAWPPLHWLASVASISWQKEECLGHHWLLFGEWPPCFQEQHCLAVRSFRLHCAQGGSLWASPVVLQSLAALVDTVELVGTAGAVACCAAGT